MNGSGLLASAARPAAGSRVDVAVRGHCPLPAQIVDIDAHEITVTAPVMRDGTRPRVGIGSDITVGWSGADGQFQMRAWLTGVARSDDVHWLLEVLEQPTRVERRSRVRVAVDLDVELSAGDRSWPASAFDLSEGGMRLVLGRNSAAPLTSAVICMFDVGRPVTASATVLRVVPVGRDHVEVALEFDAVSDPPGVSSYITGCRRPH